MTITVECAGTRIDVSAVEGGGVHFDAFMYGEPYVDFTLSAYEAIEARRFMLDLAQAIDYVEVTP